MLGCGGLCDQENTQLSEHSIRLSPAGASRAGGHRKHKSQQCGNA